MNNLEKLLRGLSTEEICRRMIDCVRTGKRVAIANQEGLSITYEEYTRAGAICIALTELAHRSKINEKLLLISDKMILDWFGDTAEWKIKHAERMHIMQSDIRHKDYESAYHRNDED